MPELRGYRYRYNAAECLRAAQQARDLFHRKVHLSMAQSWLSLARQDEATAVRFSKVWSTPTIPTATGSLRADPFRLAGRLPAMAAHHVDCRNRPEQACSTGIVPSV
jgi:hypothetical protein